MTNSNLIPVFNGSIQNTQIQLCNARELHSFVESKQDYSNWIRNRINDYGFIQDEDYIIVTERTSGRPRKEYHITLDMGKELAMVERNEKGRQIRKYFILCERKAKEAEKLALQNTQQQLALPEPTISIEFTANEWRRLINVWTLFTRYEESVSFLLKAVAPFAHGHTISSAQFNHSRAKPALLETVPMIRQIIAQLPQTVKFHESRKQIAHKYDF